MSQSPEQTIFLEQLLLFFLSSHTNLFLIRSQFYSLLAHTFKKTSRSVDSIFFVLLLFVLPCFVCPLPHISSQPNQTRASLSVCLLLFVLFPHFFHMQNTKFVPSAGPHALSLPQNLARLLQEQLLIIDPNLVWIKFNLASQRGRRDRQTRRDGPYDNV